MGSTMTIGRRFIVTSGALVLLSTVLALVAILGFNKVRGDVHSLSTDSIPGIVYGSAMDLDVANIRGDELRYISATDPSEMQKWEESIAAKSEQLAKNIKAYEDTISSDEDRQTFSKVKPLVESIHGGWAKVVPLVRESKSAEALQIFSTEVRPNILALQEQLDVIVELNKKGADTTLGATTQATQSGWWLTIIMGSISVVVGVGLSWFMIAVLEKQLTRSVTELTEGADQITSAASQVSASSQSLAQGSSEQAASLEETSSSSEEINSMARKNTDNSESMAKLVGQSQEMFVKTNQQLQDMVVSMDEINQSSGKISKIIKVIDEIAFQTNILALNAAVEAARAGEAGMGFAVVADEVRNLAQRSAQAAKDTTILIEESISKSHDGKAKVDQVAIAIRAITEDSGKIKVLVDEVTLGSEEQSRGLEQIARAISQMEQVTQTTAANAEESAAAAEELNAQSEALKDVVAQLNAMVGGGNNAGRSRVASGRSAQSRREPSASKANLSFTSHLNSSKSPRPAIVTKSNGNGTRQHSAADEKNEFPMEETFKAF